MHRKSYTYTPTHTHTHHRRGWKCCRPNLLFGGHLEVVGTLLQVPRCDVTAMASVDWLEGRVLVILISCLVLLSLCISAKSLRSCVWSKTIHHLRELETSFTLEKTGFAVLTWQYMFIIQIFFGRQISSSVILEDDSYPEHFLWLWWHHVTPLYTLLPSYAVFYPPQTHPMATPPVLLNRLSITPLWDCSAPGPVDTRPPLSTGPETWNKWHMTRPTQDSKQNHWPLPSYCRLKAWHPTTTRLHAWARTLHSNNQQSAAHEHVRNREWNRTHHSPNFSHISLKTSSAPPDVPPAEPECFAYVTTSKQYLMLSCSWDGGAPKALVWWEGPGGQGKGGEENSNILILRYGTARGGNPYICHAKHPLLVQTKTCRLTLGQYTLSDPP